MAQFKTSELELIAHKFDARFIYGYGNKAKTRPINKQVGWMAKNGFTQQIPIGVYDSESDAWEVTNEEATQVVKFLGISW